MTLTALDMLHFLSAAHESMVAARRTSPLPQDFNVALALADLQPSSLKPHLHLDLPESIVQPHIPPPAPAEAPPPNLAPMLGIDLADTQHRSHPYIPSHFPALPSRHAWQSTSVFTEREKDPRKIRERATQEGILAEQALRKLTAANKPRVKTAQTVTEVDRRKERVWQDMLSDVLGGDGMLLQDSGVDVGAGEDKMKTGDLMRAGAGMVVNHDRGHWRRSAPARAMKS